MNKVAEIEIGERIISFEKAETNHDKETSPKHQSNEACIYIAHNVNKLSREWATLNAVYEEIFKLHIILLNQGWSIF